MWEATERADQRSRNRLREHSNRAGDHILCLMDEKIIPWDSDGRGATVEAALFDCSCGWVGWIPADHVRRSEGKGTA